MALSNEPMTFDDLSQLYREELNSNCIMVVRKDLYQAVANLLTNLRQTYEKLLSEDPESVMCDGANLNFKNAESTWKKIVNMRAKKICNMAIRAASGSVESSDILAKDEEEYFHTVTQQTRAILNRVSNLRGKKTRDTRIDVDFVNPEPVVEVVPQVKPEVVPEVPPVSDDPFDEPFDEVFDEPIPDPEDFYVEDESIATGSMDAAAPQPVPVMDAVDGSEAESCPDPLTIGPEDEVVDDELIPVPIRVLEDLPEFVGPQRTYKLMREDVVTMPLVMAQALADSGKAVMIKPSS